MASTAPLLIRPAVAGRVGVRRKPRGQWDRDQ
jgi:hypothetical protein